MADSPKHLAPARPLHRSDLGLTALRTAFGAAGRIAPGVTARAAEALFFRTPRGAARAEEVAFLNTAARFTVRAAGEQVAGYHWGGSGPLVVFAHGWLSNAGRVASLAEAILAAGGQVASFDAPGHGRSTGWRSSMPEFAAALRVVVAQVGPAHALIGHSLGGAASVFAVSRGLPVNRLVTIAAPSDISGWAHRFRDQVGLSSDVYARMQRNAEHRLAITWSDLDIPIAARALRLPGLVVHDVHDPDVPWSDGEALVRSWPGAEFLSTEGLGHRAILRDPEVIRRVVEFVTR